MPHARKQTVGGRTTSSQLYSSSWRSIVVLLGIAVSLTSSPDRHSPVVRSIITKSIVSLLPV